MTTPEDAKSAGVGQPARSAFGVEVVEQRVRLEAGVRPERAEDVEEVRHEHERQR